MEGLERNRPLCGTLLSQGPHPGQDNEGKAEDSGTHHLLIAIGVHHPGLTVVAEAHEEGGHKVVTVEQTSKASARQWSMAWTSGARFSVWSWAVAAAKLVCLSV